MATFSDTWNSAYEIIPDGTEDVRLGDNRIRELKRDIRERLQIDHSWSGDGHDGEHEQITIRFGSVLPVPEALRGYLFANILGKLQYILTADEAQDVVTLETGTGLFTPTKITLSSTEPDSADDLDVGEIFIQYETES